MYVVGLKLSSLSQTRVIIFPFCIIIMFYYNLLKFDWFKGSRRCYLLFQCDMYLVLLLLSVKPEMSCMCRYHFMIIICTL